MQRACDDLAARAAALQAQGLPLNNMVAAIEVRSPACILVAFMPRVNAGASVIQSGQAVAASTELHPYLRWLEKEDEPGDLRLVMSEGDRAWTLLLSDLARAVRERNEQWQTASH